MQLVVTLALHGKFTYTRGRYIYSTFNCQAGYRENSFKISGISCRIHRHIIMQMRFKRSPIHPGLCRTLAIEFSAEVADANVCVCTSDAVFFAGDKLATVLDAALKVI